MIRGLIVTLAVVAMTGAAWAQMETEFRDRFCADFATRYTLSDGSEADCISDDFAIEVDFLENWRDAIGQALHYALMTNLLTGFTPREPAIVLVCRGGQLGREDCIPNMLGAKRLIEHYKLPITVFDCYVEDASLGQCQRLDPPE